ncbi:MAG: VOC family protein [Gammaproteobacteria bacterium]|nr:VOC family protein [Gammaproteobacteria bacterium]
MTETAPSADTRPAVVLKPVHNMHHTAYRCRDAEQTRWFYEDVLGFKLIAALAFDEEPGRAVQREFMHLFFETTDGNCIAFFDAPDDADESMFVARPCFGPINHHFVHSIYMYDPNGLQVELTVKDADYQGIMTRETAKAHADIQQWTERTRAIKEARLDKNMLDLRGIDTSKVDLSGLKKS